MDSFSANCVVTGSMGYVGSRIAECFATRGWRIFEFARRPRASPIGDRLHVPFQLESQIDPGFFRDQDIRVVIHCAYDFRPVTWSDIHRINVEGSVRFLRAAKKGGVEKIIFISSISAFEGCRSLYGRAKLEIERVAAELGAYIVRPGLVYENKESGGMFGSLQRLVTKSSVVPLIGSGQYLQYLVHADDLCGLLLKICRGEIEFRPASMVAASPHGMQLRVLLQQLGNSRGVMVRFIPLPWHPIWLGLKVFEMMGLSTNFRSDSVISLVRQNPAPDFSTAARLGYHFREFESCHAFASTSGSPDSS